LARQRKVLSSDHPDITTSLNNLGFVLEIFGQTEKALAEEQRAATDTRFQSNPDAPFAHPYFWAPFIFMGNGL
jgi:CHAT domain-containing protein